MHAATLCARPGDAGSGQIIVLFALVLTVVVLAVGLVIDGGKASPSAAASQNASDFGALGGGARRRRVQSSGDTVNGTDANVQSAITLAVDARTAGPHR